ncbi:MAG: 5-methyltetrahydrofolate--homocysteine methyltransferase [Firmicutes bacterium]|nr:5-methyltetrahydrofolate--homocysteine methyltransferase [Bacillota bacterium]MDI6706341.1 homocysteine S-methyltransferase family protein [Bacillota bacterium]
MAYGKELERVLIFDGAMGTMLQNAGLKPGECPEMMNIEAPEKILEIHSAYIEAGADVITTNTFGGNRIKLAEYGLGNRVEEVNGRAVEIARKAAGDKGRLVAASVGPTGHFVYPVGDLAFDEAYEVFREQVEAIAAAGPDFILLETFSDMGEIRAAFLAARDTCSIPVICCFTFNKERTLTGVSPASAAVVMSSLGAAAVGANCSGGPQELLIVAEQMLNSTGLPVIIQPNAGLPIMKDGKAVYSMDAETFKTKMEPYFQLGINLLGSCCGSTPDYTRSLRKRADSYAPGPRKYEKVSTLASRENVIVIGDNRPTVIVGERINPTARKNIRESLIKGDYGVIQEEAENQVEKGADLIDINAGVHGIDQAAVMTRLVNLLQQNIAAPIVLDTTEPRVLEKALKAYHGKALVNSVNGDDSSLKATLPIIKRYGAGVIGLTLDESGIPESAEGRYAIAEKIVRSCVQHGIPIEDIYIDCLVMAAGTGAGMAVETLRALRMVKDNLNVRTVLGISNVSHGMPSRGKLNTAFLAMAIAGGLDLAIVNPMDAGIMDTWQAACLLAGRDRHAMNYLKHNSDSGNVPEQRNEDSGRHTLEAVRSMIIKGSQRIEEAVEALLHQGKSPQEIIDMALVPGLAYTGDRFEEGQIYLPQLMLSAETAQRAFAVLERCFEKAGVYHNKGTVVIGTVKGDIHDIGKNMVAVMLRNSGYRVIDLGKNVTPEEFINASKREKAEVAALSALMTTTMVEIPITIKRLKEAVPGIRVIAGGAVVTEDFALKAGADGYGKDAVSAVRIVEHLRGKHNG